MRNEFTLEDYSLQKCIQVSQGVPSSTKYMLCSLGLAPIRIEEENYGLVRTRNQTELIRRKLFSDSAVFEIADLNLKVADHNLVGIFSLFIPTICMALGLLGMLFFVISLSQQIYVYVIPTGFMAFSFLLVAFVTIQVRKSAKRAWRTHRTGR